MILLSHPTANAFVRSAAGGLMDAGLLSEFHTCVAVFDGTALSRLASYKMFVELRRRKFDLRLKQITHTSPWIEIGRQISQRLGINRFTRDESSKFSVDTVYRRFDEYVAGQLRQDRLSSLTGIYAYEDAALKSFEQARKIGAYCYYDLPIGYWRAARAMLETELERWPEWASTITGLKDSPEKLERKDEELRRADKIVVASRFTAETLTKFPGTLAPVSIIPYAFPNVHAAREYSRIAGRRKVRLLFVGGLSQRKGIADLFAAVAGLSSFVELTVIGYKATSQCPALNAALAKHTWIPSLPHHEVLKVMREHDVLVFPSLFEGFGLVITEAMSQGTPVITTERTAGPDLLRHGENGWLIKAGSTTALRAAIEEIIARPDQIFEVGREAMVRASSRTWEMYGREVALEVSADQAVNHEPDFKFPRCA